MSAKDFYRPGIYRVKVRKQPPSVLLLIAAAVLAAAGIALGLAVAAVRAVPIELDLIRGLQSLLGDSVLRLSLRRENQLTIVLVAVLLAVVGVLVLRRWSSAGFFALAMLSAYLYMELLKRPFARPRPTADLVQVYQTSESFSFPSVIVGLVVVCVGLISYLMVRAYRARPLNETRDTIALIVVLLASLLLVALSSLAVLALGSHWPSDVLGSYLFGGAYTIIAVLARRQWMKWRGTDKL